MQGNTRLSYLAARDHDARAERRRRVTGWRTALRWRRPLDTHLAQPLWAEFLRSHDGNVEAALGELLAAVMEMGGIREEPRW